METITVLVGTLETLDGGHTQDGRREVTFEGEKLGGMTTYGYGRNGSLTETRGVTQTLYRAADGRLVAHVDEWSRWRGEPNIGSLYQVAEEDLRAGGRFEDLGYACGFYGALTLDEALREMAAADEL